MFRCGAVTRRGVVAGRKALARRGAVARRKALARCMPCHGSAELAPAFTSQGDQGVGIAGSPILEEDSGAGAPMSDLSPPPSGRGLGFIGLAKM